MDALEQGMVGRMIIWGWNDGADFKIRHGLTVLIFA